MTRLSQNAPLNKLSLILLQKLYRYHLKKKTASSAEHTFASGQYLDNERGTVFKCKHACMFVGCTGTVASQKTSKLKDAKSRLLVLVEWLPLFHYPLQEYWVHSLVLLE
ncbi:uncharacterized protein EV154DRAFT_488079 [Mucor mucedo]|uniref:uncharacterized protein n=1 Tax=Mucor mucedo TaxID=29922 RepID=UPI002220E1CE|nr:uncharacterized protein EV154DRAFT_488079 [Mucor mucedo]KAI7868828.1 hypothetical protein EV154DRAFT_488079 [Mucor mucedo]